MPHRVAAHRRGGTTIVTTVSPLWLRRAEPSSGVLLGAGEVIASGTHSELIETSAPIARCLVTRDLDTTNLTNGASPMTDPRNPP